MTLKRTRYVKMFLVTFVFEILLELVGYQGLGHKIYGYMWESGGPSEKFIHLVWMLIVSTPVLFGWLVSQLKKESRYVSTLKDKENEFQSMFYHNSDGVVAFDIHGKITRLNPAFTKMSGYVLDEVTGLQRASLLPEQQQAIAQEHFTRALRGEPQSFENILIHKQGHPIYVESKNIPINSNGEIVGVYAILKDITERKRHDEELWNLAHHDHLTGFANRRRFSSRLNEVLETAKQTHQGIGVLFVDLDRFKFINDSLGHDIGDEVLKTVSQRISQHLKPQDLLARLGGDEFAVLLPQMNHVSEAERTAQRLLDTIQPPICLDGFELTLTASIGIATYPANGDSKSSLLKSADIAMYEAKRAGRSQYRIHMPSMSQVAYEKLKLETDLLRALRTGGQGLYLEYQPQVNVTTGQVIGAEALIRWNHPVLGKIGPGEFIPLAEETGLIVPLGEFVLQTVSKQIQEWVSKESSFTLPISINISAIEFQKDDFVHKVINIVEETGILPELIGIEVTETAIMKNERTMIEKIKQLREFGIKIYVDDFGKGYSSLGFLKQFPLDGLKIDRIFVSDIDTNEDDASIVKALVSLAHTRLLNVTAEGVEEPTQLQVLSDCDCDDYQGFLFSQPMGSHEFFTQYVATARLP